MNQPLTFAFALQRIKAMKYLDVSRLNEGVDFGRRLWQYILVRGTEATARAPAPQEVTMSIIIINGIATDASRGYDVMRGSKVLRHFDTYAEARAYAALSGGCYVRYWGVKEGK